MTREHTFVGLIAVSATLLLAACGGPTDDPEPLPTPEDPMAHAQELAQKLIVIDTHIDVPYRLNKTDTPDDVTQRTDGGDFDWPRAKAGGLDGAFMSIYVPADYQEPEFGGTGGARAFADQLIDMVEDLAERAPDRFALAYTPDDVLFARRNGQVALPMGMENGAPIEDLAALKHFYDRGIRYITLTHGKDNAISDSSYVPADDRRWNGISPFGREVVVEMNRLGIMVDISHVTDDAATQVLAVTKAPVIASHSSCRKFTPGFERNMSDELIRKLAENGGVLQINYGSAFLTAASNEQSMRAWRENLAAVAEAGVDPDSPEAEAISKAWWENEPRIYADVTDVADHIDHVVQLVGVDHVGLGSDFDGVGDSLPTGLKDVSEIPNLLAELIRRGYSDEDIAKIAGDNVLRVWRAVDEVARSSK